jgi:hypothetical protein
MNCDVVCLQETKREHFDVAYLKIFCHRHLDKFELHPLFGSSGGLITIWNGSHFIGEKIFEYDFTLSVELHSLHSKAPWVITNVDMPDDTDWLVVGDFNLLRWSNDRNKPGANLSEIFYFNVAISSLSLCNP